MLANKDQRPAALAIMARGKSAPAPAAPLHNRQGAPTPGTDKTLSKGADDEAKAEAAFHADVLDYKNSKQCTYEEAHKAVTNRRRAASAAA
jgi:hypothetical protein